MAEARHAAGRVRARVVLLASPAVVLLAVFFGHLLNHDGLIFSGATAVVILGAGGFVAVYFGRARERRSWKVAALAAVPLGLAYFFAATAVALVVIMLIAGLR